MKSLANQSLFFALCTIGLASFMPGCASFRSRSLSHRTHEFVDDATISKQITTQFVEDLGIRKESVTVETTRGVVLLKGTVENAPLRDRANRIANETRGVQSVVNEIRLAEGVPPTAPNTQP